MNFFCVFIAIFLMLCGCSPTVDNNNDNKISQNSKGNNTKKEVMADKSKKKKRMNLKNLVQ